VRSSRSVGKTRPVTSGAAAQTTARWRLAGEARDSGQAAECFSDDVQVISPLTAQFRFRGREQAHQMLTAAFIAIDSITFHTEVGDDATRALFYYGRCRGVDFEEAQLLRFDDAGKISELTLFGRPLPGLTAVMAAIGPEMLRADERPALATLIKAATSPLAAITKLAEKTLVPLADPSRSRSSRNRT
jgi:hypothetical protein